ncbi:MAG TPA: SURF1 family protein, partial [Actinopolymorphaceae bacterium]
RNDERGAENARIEKGLSAPARPVDQVLAPGRPVEETTEWRVVTAVGRYDAEHELLVRYRHLEGEPGFEVLTPLITPDGTALLVDRGWVPGSGARDLPDVPPPPQGEVTVTGRVRASESSGSAGQVRPETGEIRFIDVPRIAEWVPYGVYGGYVELTEQRPEPGDRPRLLPPPSLDAGPFLSYGIQWYLFGAIALIGLAVLAYDEANDGKLRERWKRPATTHEDDN